MAYGNREDHSAYEDAANGGGTDDDYEYEDEVDDEVENSSTDHDNITEDSVDEDAEEDPIVLEKSGGFAIGGQIITRPNGTQTLSCDHGYMEYFIPWTPRKTSLVMWHSSSTQVWQNRWDGGEGYKDKFLRRDYPVYLWDGPRVGRANWGCKQSRYSPSYRDQGNFASWRFGPRFGTFYEDTQFPTDDDEAWNQATRARYEEFDTTESVELHATVAAVAADSGKIGRSIVYLTNSAGGLRAQLTATKSQKRNIKAIVAYESAGFVYPDDASVRAGRGGFGPFVVPAEDFAKLAKLKAVQFVWGAHRSARDSAVRQSRNVAELINGLGGNAEVVMLEDEGLEGSTHIPFADMNNGKVAKLLNRFLKKNRLDDYVEE